MAQRYVHIQIPETCKYYLMWQKKVIKLKTLRIEAYPSLCSWVRNTLISIIMRGRESFERQTHREEKVVWICSRERQPQARKRRPPLQLGEVRKVCLWEPLEEAQPCLHLDFKHLASRTQLRENKSLSLQTTTVVVICYSGHRTLIHGGKVR